MCGNLTAPLDIWGGLVEEFIFNIQQNRKNKESCYYVWFRQWTRRLLNPIMLNLNSEGKLDSFFAVSWATSIKKTSERLLILFPLYIDLHPIPLSNLNCFPATRLRGHWIRNYMTKIWIYLNSPGTMDWDFSFIY